MGSKTATNKPSAKRRHPKSIYSENERHRLAGNVLVSINTVRRWERGEKVRARTHKDLMLGARKLGLPVPEREDAR